MPNIYSLPEEVIIRICSYVVVKHPVGFIEDQKSLARLARACRALSLPALTILWHTLPNILPLLSTLPVDLCVRETLPPLNGNGLPQVYFGFARVPTSADFSRWKLYSVLVRDITSLHDTSSPPSTTVLPEIWAVLALHGPRPLVPYIKALNEQDYAIARYPLAVSRLLFSSTMTSYALATANPDLELVPHLDALAERSPFLRKLHVSWDYGSPQCVVPMAHQPRTSLSPSFRAFSYMRDLSIRSIDVLPPALRSIGALPSLEKLDISVSSADYPAFWKSFITEQDSDYFPQLRTLVCKATDLAIVAAILQLVSSPLVERLNLNSSHSHQASFERLCEVLSRHPSREALHTMSHTGRLGEPCDLNAAFTYLLALPAITEIYLGTSSIVMLSDDTLEAMARAWPRLEKLDLHHYKYNPSTSFQDNFSQLEYRATLKGLSAFAYNCPSLKILTLPIDPWCDAFYRADDAGAPGWEYDFRPVAPTRSALIGLYVGFIDPTYPEQVAAILSALFPLLDHVGHGDLDEGLYNFPGWEEVNRVLRAFKGIRGLVAGDGA